MAVTLTGLGLALTRWQARLERRTAGRARPAGRGRPAGRARPGLRRFVPVATSTVVLLVGLGIAVQAIAGLV
jgi:hypothetical protein